jgi:hypothetical protein
MSTLPPLQHSDTFKSECDWEDWNMNVSPIALQNIHEQRITKRQKSVSNEDVTLSMPTRSIDGFESGKEGKQPPREESESNSCEEDEFKKYISRKIQW